MRRIALGVDGRFSLSVAVALTKSVPDSSFRDESDSTPDLTLPLLRRIKKRVKQVADGISPPRLFLLGSSFKAVFASAHKPT